MSDIKEADQLVALLLGHLFHFSGEKSLQDGIAGVLKGGRIPFFKEYRLGRAGVVDFYLRRTRTAVEVKTKGTMSALLRQLMRYAECPEVARLVVVTNRRHLASLPETLADKPLQVIILLPRL